MSSGSSVKDSQASSQKGQDQPKPQHSAATGVTLLLKSASFQKAAETILKYGENLKNQPNDEKVRQINLANMAFQTRVYQIPGGEECMSAMGFVKEGGFLVFRDDSFRRVDNVLIVLRAALATKAKAEQAQKDAQKKAEQEASEQPNRAEMFRLLTAQIGRMRIYENPQLQEEARRCIPTDELKRRAATRKDVTEKSDADRLLLELLAWFKKEFFSWVDSLPCDFCGKKTKVAGVAPPTQDEIRWEASRVEMHQCETCGRTTRFPRYNHPGKLLKTRRGRCGEWANCFVLCCRSLGFETRYVLDYTDHVWAEVFSEHQNCWLHCDACENTCNKPLMYERGWGKKLSYAFAFGIHEVADVIWRYSRAYEQTLSRRNKVSEDWLSSTIRLINSQMVSALPQIEQERIFDRLERERHMLIAGLSSSPSVSTEELLGRQSGNEAWRRARGELGDIVRASNEAEITARTSKSHSTGATTGNASTTEGDATKQNDKRSNKDSKLGPSQPESAFHGIGLAQSQHEVSLTESKHDNGTG
eukprot:gene9533-10402_t